MNESSGTMSSSLAITEKRPQRPGGCVGILFQFLDWNRRLAKKKLFSKKLLPPVRPKRASKKFCEKMPMAKLLLIADENRGGFPNAKKHDMDNGGTKRNHEMRAPGLVARLMGLESIPAGRRNNLKKDSCADTCYIQEGADSDICTGRTSDLLGFNKEDLNLKKGHVKLESRPQKLQKTGLSERRPITRFGAEALHFKSVLSRSRKYQPKLASPVKSPRIPYRRKATRLVEAATKILEPGLQAASRAKCSLTYSASLQAPSSDEVMMEGTFITVDQSNQSSYCINAAESLMGQTSRKSSSNLPEVVDVRSNADGQLSGFASSALDFSDAHCQGSGRSKLRQSNASLNRERISSSPKFQDSSVSLALEPKQGTHTASKIILDRRPPFRKDQVQHRTPFQQCKYKKEVPSTINEQKMKKQNQMLSSKDRIVTRSISGNPHSRKVSCSSNSIDGAKDFIALKKNLNNCTQLRVSTNGERRNVCHEKDDSASQLRTSVGKIRLMNGTVPVERAGSIASSTAKKIHIRGNTGNGKVKELNGRCMIQTCVKSRPLGRSEGSAATANSDAGIVSFTFNSPMKNSNGCFAPTEIEKRRTQGDPLSNGTKQKRLIFDEKDGHLSSQKPVPLRGEALGVLLEQKLKELTFQDGDEMAPRDALPEKSTVSILQELLFALTAARDTSQEDRDNLAVGFHRKKYHGTADPSGQESIDDHALNTKRNFKAEEKASVVSPGFPLIGDSDHYSPGSVLEASFSNDSCHSRSFDDNAGHGWHPESMDCSFNQRLSSDQDSACVDSTTSLRRGTRSDLGTVLNNISVNLYGTDLDKIGLTGLILNHAGRVIMNAELLFGNATLDHADTREDFLAGLLDKLDTHVNILQRCPNSLLGFMEAKDGFWLRRFLFDCMIEFLDSEYGCCIASGFKPRTKVPLHENSELLMTEVYQEIRRWTNLAGKTPDEIIEWEMSHSLGKWTDFEIEVHETGAEIEGEIFWVLIDETLIDLCECWLI